MRLREHRFPQMSQRIEARHFLLRRARVCCRCDESVALRTDRYCDAPSQYSQLHDHKKPNSSRFKARRTTEPTFLSRFFRKTKLIAGSCTPQCRIASRTLSRHRPQHNEPLTASLASKEQQPNKHMQDLQESTHPPPRPARSPSNRRVF